jgi:hypothetical protein
MTGDAQPDELAGDERDPVRGVVGAEPRLDRRQGRPPTGTRAASWRPVIRDRGADQARRRCAVLGMGLPPSGTLHREFHRAQARYNRMHPDEVLPVASIHAVRHGWATLSLESGVPIRVVQDRLNHSSEKVAADIYTQVREPAQSDVAERLPHRSSARVTSAVVERQLT